MITLRPYQNKLIQDIRQSLARHKHTLAILPTGGGKTAIASYIAKAAFQRGKRVMFTCHRDFLVEQTSEAFKESELPHTFVAAGQYYNPHSTVQIASIDTLKRRLEIVKAPDIIIIDEAVHAAASGWAKVIEHYQRQGCFTIGLTACSERLSGKGLGDWFHDLVEGPSTAELIEQGFLSQYKAYNHTTADLSGIRKIGGELSLNQSADRMDKPAITGNAVKEYTKIAAGRQGLMFCCSIQHSENVAAAFKEAGYAACHIGANTDKTTRRDMLRDYRAGKIKVLTSVDIFNEGFNVPSASYAGLLRPTASLSIFLQQCGRVLRAEKGKDFAFISDHANNICYKNGDRNHGFPDDIRKWTLEDRDKKQRDNGEKTISVRVCPMCAYSFRPAPVCPACQFEMPIQHREVEQIDGELEEITAAKLAQKQEEAKKKRMEVGRARTQEDLERIADERSYHWGWVKRQCAMKRIRYTPRSLRA